MDGNLENGNGNLTGLVWALGMEVKGDMGMGVGPRGRWLAACTLARVEGTHPPTYSLVGWAVFALLSFARSAYIVGS